MKKLIRMKLINWHRFTNNTIAFGDSTLLSGENGAGKSTLLDAIQFVITCSANSFNKAAHENGKRKLTGYIRCKTGKENKPYERMGAISAHIALEFYEESRKQYFIVGAAIDSASEGQETTARYLMDNIRLTDDMFFQGNTPRSITQFRTANKNIKQWCKTQAEAKRVMKSRFGRIEDKFFALIPKAMAFKPIDDIKDFVYSYVLDEKEVNIDVLRENVRTYQELEKTLESVKKRIQKLEDIEKFHGEVIEGQRRDKMYEFYLERAELDIALDKIKKMKDAIEADTDRKHLRQKDLERVATGRDEKQEIATSLRVELKQDKGYLALEEQKKELASLEKSKENKELGKQELLLSVNKALEQTKKLLEVRDVDSCISEYRKALQDVDKVEDVAYLKQLTKQVISYKNSMCEKAQRKQVEIKIAMEQLQKEADELERKIQRLKQKKFLYPIEVDRVLNGIKEEFARIGREPEPKILCELLEITDERWRNAVEGYLNTQRFYILVEPENFDIALGTYNRLRKERKAYGVGLINAQKLDAYDEALEGTLATVVTSKDKYAKRFSNMILGKVHMCERYDQLKQYPISITRECMKYQNHVANAIKPEVFETPYVGLNAIKMQLEQKKQEKVELDKKIAGYKERMTNLEYVLPALKTEADTDILYRVDALLDLRNLQYRIVKTKSNIAALEKNSNMIQKQIQLSELEELIREANGSIAQLNQEIGRLEERITAQEAEKGHQQVLQIERQEKVAGLGNMAGDSLILWNCDYEKQTANKSYEQFRDNYVRRRKANETTTKNAERSMVDAMCQYKAEHDFGAAPSMEGYSDFAAVYERLRTSELLAYEEKVQSARKSAEDEFREQFLAKLQENMKQAQNEFKELNKALKDIVFSNERYEFLYLPSKRYRQYYEMIMDDFNALQGESIFSGIFHQNHKEVIDELFERLALDNENNAKALDEFTDYRTYMDYDIRIVHSDDSYSFYSKVCEEKSGGETQTPFYVTVAASFVQLYGNNIGGESIGLVMFDEAFNNMDDERIGGVLEFLRRLPLQIVIAAPPDKIQYISPVMEETLLVMTDEKVSYVERYHNGVL